MKEKQYKLNSRQKKWPNLKCMNKTPGKLEMTTSISQKANSRDFPGGPVADSTLPMQWAWVQSLVRKLDPTCQK